MVTFSHISLQFIEDLSSAFTVFKFLGSEQVPVVHCYVGIVNISASAKESDTLTLLIPKSIFQSIQYNPFTILTIYLPQDHSQYYCVYSTSKKLLS
jgi:hypothetical protein